MSATNWLLLSKVLRQTAVSQDANVAAFWPFIEQKLSENCWMDNSWYRGKNLPTGNVSGALRFCNATSTTCEGNTKAKRSFSLYQWSLQAASLGGLSGRKNSNTSVNCFGVWYKLVTNESHGWKEWKRFRKKIPKWYVKEELFSILWIVCGGLSVECGGDWGEKMPKRKQQISNRPRKMRTNTSFHLSLSRRTIVSKNSNKIDKRPFMLSSKYDLILGILVFCDDLFLFSIDLRILRMTFGPFSLLNEEAPYRCQNKNINVLSVQILCSSWYLRWLQKNIKNHALVIMSSLHPNELLKLSYISSLGQVALSEVIGSGGRSIIVLNKISFLTSVTRKQQQQWLGVITTTITNVATTSTVWTFVTEHTKSCKMIDQRIPVSRPDIRVLHRQ